MNIEQIKTIGVAGAGSMGAGITQVAAQATKFMPFPWRTPFASALMSSLRASLDRLGLPWVHLYQIHGAISLRSARTEAAALARARSSMGARQVDAHLRAHGVRAVRVCVGPEGRWWCGRLRRCHTAR